MACTTPRSPCDTQVSIEICRKSGCRQGWLAPESDKNIYLYEKNQTRYQIFRGGFRGGKENLDGLSNFHMKRLSKYRSRKCINSSGQASLPFSSQTPTHISSPYILIAYLCRKLSSSLTSHLQALSQLHTKLPQPARFRKCRLHSSGASTPAISINTISARQYHHGIRITKGQLVILGINSFYHCKVMVQQ